MKVLYRIQHPCRQQVRFTTDPDEAEYHSRNGCIVTTPPLQKIYKHSNNYQPGRWDTI